MGRSNFTLHRANECEHVEDHTACPDGYIQWHAWAAEMSKTHRQRKCPSCGLYAIWEPKTARAILSKQDPEYSGRVEVVDEGESGNAGLR